MKLSMLKLIVLLFFFVKINALIDPVLDFVSNNIHNFRKTTFEKALYLLELTQAKVIVETGTARYGTKNLDGDGGSTIIFGYWSFLNHAHMYSVDISAEAVANATTAIAAYKEYVHVIKNDSVEFLRNFSQKIDFLYLDSFDFDENNPDPSQQHHLREIEAAYDKLAPKAIVMIDDCKLAHCGKCRLVIDFLLKKGWNVVADEYQIIFMR